MCQSSPLAVFQTFLTDSWDISIPISCVCPPTSYTSVSKSARQAFCLGLSERPKTRDVAFLWGLDVVKGGYFLWKEGGRSPSLPAPVQGAWLCHATSWCWGHPLGFLKWKRMCWQSEGVQSVTVERGWWYSAKLAHYFGMIWALSAGREGLSPTQSLIGNGCLSLSVCLCVCVCMFVLVWVRSCLYMYTLCVCLNVCVHMYERCETPLDKLCVCHKTHAASAVPSVNLCASVCVCVRHCVS